MVATNRWSAALRTRPAVVDAAIAVTVWILAVVLINPERTNPDPNRGVLAVVAALSCATLLVRRRRPILVLVLTTAGLVGSTILIGGETILALALMIALYTVAADSDRRTTVLAWGATASVLALLSVETSLVVGPSLIGLTYLPWTAAAAALGDALRNRRAYVASVEERAAYAERTREQEARRRVADERVRIARDLHDVVAHRVAVINVQSGVANHLLTARPEDARAAIGHVRDAAGSILSELGDILDVLRESDQATALSPTHTVPGLAGVDALVGSFAAAGLAVQCSLSGRPRPLAAAVDVAAYRLLQEALTNAHRHGTGSARVTVEYADAQLALAVSNPVPGPANGSSASSESGWGLVGMRERASTVGGVVHAAAGPSGEFRVEAVLPLVAGESR